MSIRTNIKAVIKALRVSMVGNTKDLIKARSVPAHIKDNTKAVIKVSVKVHIKANIKGHIRALLAQVNIKISFKVVIREYIRGNIKACIRVNIKVQSVQDNTRAVIKEVIKAAAMNTRVSIRDPIRVLSEIQHTTFRCRGVIRNLGNKVSLIFFYSSMN